MVVVVGERVLVAWWHQEQQWRCQQEGKQRQLPWWNAFWRDGVKRWSVGICLSEWKKLFSAGWLVLKDRMNAGWWWDTGRLDGFIYVFGPCRQRLILSSSFMEPTTFDLISRADGAHFHQTPTGDESRQRHACFGYIHDLKNNHQTTMHWSRI